MPAQPLLLTPMVAASSATPTLVPTPVVTAPVVTVPVVVAPDLKTQIESSFAARQLILEELIVLGSSRGDLASDTAVTYAVDVAANGVDPAKALSARDAWKTSDALLAAQSDALNDLLVLIEARIDEFKQTSKFEVSAVLRDQIAALSQDLSETTRAGQLTEDQLKVLWNELRDVDPGCLSTMAKMSSAPAETEKSVATTGRSARKKV